MGVSSRTLEITVMSGENVTVIEDAYVVVRAESLNCCTTRTVAKDNGNNDFLWWNEKFSMEMPMHARSITFEVQCNRFKGSRPIGVARIAASDILHTSAVPEVFSYGLRDWQGRRNGVIHFALRVAPPSEKRFSLKSTAEPLLPRNNKCNEVVVDIPNCWKSATTHNIV